MTKIAKVLSLRPRQLHAVLARQEPPVNEGPQSTPEEDFAEDLAPEECPIKSYCFDLSKEEEVAVRAFIETYRRLKKSLP